jgi:hypothetical protein
MTIIDASHQVPGTTLFKRFPVPKNFGWDRNRRSDAARPGQSSNGRQHHAATRGSQTENGCSAARCRT